MNELESLIEYKGLQQPILKENKKILHTDEEINNLIRKYNFYLKDFQKQHNYSEELITILTLIQISLNDLYGKNINDIFYTVMDKNRIYLEKGHTYEVCQKYGLEETNPNISGFYTINKPINLFEKNTKKVDQKIYIGNKMYGKKVPKIELLETLIHELRHALTSTKNNNYYLDKNNYYIRCGLTEYFFKKGNENPYAFAVIIDEIFNVYFTDILVNNILNYKNNNIDRTEFKKYLYSLKQFAKVYESTSYDLEKLICKPLFFNKKIVKTANYAAMTGDIDAFADNFYNYEDYVNFLDYLSNEFDKYYNLEYSDTTELKSLITKFKQETLRNARLQKKISFY